MRIFSIVLLTIAMLFFACRSETGQGETPSGFPYTMHVKGKGPKAEPGEYVYFHAQMRNGDEVLYASREMDQNPFLQIPLQDDPEGIPSPVEDLLKIMGVGDSATVVLNIDTMEVKPPGLEDVKELFYDVVVVKIVSNEEFQEETARRNQEERAAMEAARGRISEVAEMVQDVAKKYAAGQLANDIQSTSSGLKYIIHEEGTGDMAKLGRKVFVHYYGALPDGNSFDNSFERGEAFPFILGMGQVIPGWDEGIAMLKIGSKATLIVPPSLGYGETGYPPVIPPNSELIFYVELVKMQ